MRSRYLHLISSAGLALSLALTITLARATPNPVPPNSTAHGSGYAELAADWLEWLLAIPAASSPLLDADGAYAAVGQSGKVWFLVGTSGGPATRTVTVPVGTALFFPIVNYFWVNTPEYGDPAWSSDQEAYVRRSVLKPVVDTAYGLMLEIDGRTVPNIDKLRVAGAVGECTMPDDNIFGIPFAPGPHPCVADGYWVLLPSLSAGIHTIRFAGEFTYPNPFSLDITYHITVRGR
jgi:hypothetical protein